MFVEIHVANVIVSLLTASMTGVRVHVGVHKSVLIDVTVFLTLLFDIF